MYFIKSVLPDGRYVVFDEMYVREYILTFDEIRHMVLVSNQVIRGVTVKKNRTTGERYIDSIVAADNREEVERKCLKAKVLHGAVLTIRGDELSYLSVNPPNGKTSIRLSGFCKKLGSSVLCNGIFTGDVTFIIDDKLAINKHTFDNWYGTVKMDISAVTKMSIVNAILSDSIFEWHNWNGEYPDYDECIKDRPDRRGYPHALRILTGTFSTDQQKAFVQDAVSKISPKVHALIANRYKRKFINLCNRGLKLAPYTYPKDIYSLLTALHNGPSYDALSGLSQVLDVDYHTLTKLYNYVTFFNADQGIKGAFDSFYERAIAFVEDVEQNGVVGYNGYEVRGS